MKTESSGDVTVYQMVISSEGSCLTSTIRSAWLWR